MADIKTGNEKSLLEELVKQHFPEISDEKQEEARENLERFLMALERLLES